jgi:glycosyltransferase involved in cell wall biosynthesis
LVSLAHGRFWARWALVRALLTGYLSAADLLRCGRTVCHLPAPPRIEPLKTVRARLAGAHPPPTVSVILPTLDRYSYLFRLLEQLREQSVRPAEIIIVDQTPQLRRQSVASKFLDLPLRILVRDQPGQCSARNQAIAAARGEYMLFLDDDDEIPNDLIESHLRCLRETAADGCCGLADEAGAGSLPPGFSHFRASDVFPTNNAMLRRAALAKSGLFDRAYDRGELEDGDLGMRLLQSGALLVLNPGIRVFHHHAPRGGLRAHGARVVTYAISRHSLWARRLPAASEIYYLNRYFTPRQVRESLFLLACGTFAVRGSAWKKLAKALIATLQLPSTLLRIRAARIQADVLARSFPAIPMLHDPRGQRHQDLPRTRVEVSRAVSA